MCRPGRQRQSAGRWKESYRRDGRAGAGTQLGTSGKRTPPCPRDGRTASEQGGGQEQQVPHPGKLDTGEEFSTSQINGFRVIDNSTRGEYDEIEVDKNSVTIGDKSCRQGGYSNITLLGNGDNVNQRRVKFQKELISNVPCVNLEDKSQSTKNGNKFSICQLDGNESLQSDQSDSLSNYSTDDEVDSEPVRAVLIPAPRLAGQPFTLTVDQSEEVAAPSSLPLTMVANFRSMYNKIKNIKRNLWTLGLDFLIGSETWERPRFDITRLLDSPNYLSISYCGGRETPAIRTEGKQAGKSYPSIKG